MTGLYMGYRLGTAGSENPAQILLTVFHMVQLVLIVPFQDQVYAPFRNILPFPRVFTTCGLIYSWHQLPRLFSLIPHADQAEVFSPCHQKKWMSCAAPTGIFHLGPSSLGTIWTRNHLFCVLRTGKLVFSVNKWVYFTSFWILNFNALYNLNFA